MKAFVRFFASLKLAIVLLIVLAVASILGTLIPQGRSAAEYAARYGGLARPLIALQFTALYHSAWFLGVLFLFALNIIVCTLTRLSPKLRRALRPKVASDPKALSALAVKDRFKRNLPAADAAAEVRAALAGRRYRVRGEENDGRVFLLGRKRVLGWFGSDVVHLGLLVILAGGIVTGLGGFRTNLSLKEGEVVEVPRAGFSVRLDKFETEYYPQGGVKDWRSSLTVLEGGAAVASGVVEVNHPLSHGGFSFYQTSYGRDWENPDLELAVGKKSDAAFARTLPLKVGQKAAVGDPEGTEVVVRSFLPDFVLGEGGRAETRSSEPNNPAALVEGWQAGERVFSGWVFAKYPDFGAMHGAKETDLAFELKRYEARQVSVVEAARDPGAGFIWAGCILITAGFFLAFYWPPREIRVVVEPAQGKAEVTAGGTAAKNRDAFAAEFRGLMDGLRRSK